MAKAIKKAELKLIKAKTALTYALFAGAVIAGLTGLATFIKYLIDLFSGSGSV